MTATAPHCRFCGKAIKKLTRSVCFVPEITSYMKGDRSTRYIAGAPQTKEEAQRMVNETIVHVKRGRHPFGSRQSMPEEYIYEVSTWDGETYRDKHFCTGRCAQYFAYAIAGDERWKNVAMPAYFDAVGRASE